MTNHERAVLVSDAVRDALTHNANELCGPAVRSLQVVVKIKKSEKSDGTCGPVRVVLLTPTLEIE